MDNGERAANSFPPSGTRLVPIHDFQEGTLLRICVLLRTQATSGTIPFVLIRELPGSQVFLGAVCDARGRLQHWVEIWVQSLDLRELTFASVQEHLTNHEFDQRWRCEHQSCLSDLPDLVIITGMEEKNPRPVLVKGAAEGDSALFVPAQFANWELCKDDALLASAGLAAYSTTPFRYLYDPDAAGSKKFLATAVDTPANAHAQSIERLKDLPGVTALFNPHAGLIRVMRCVPLNLEDYLQVLEGRAWDGGSMEAGRLVHGQAYTDLQAWTASRKGIPFLFFGGERAAERLNEVLLLKLGILLGLLKEVRCNVKASQLPLLNLSPSSFSVCLPEVGAQFPALWAARSVLIKPGQAYPLKIKTTEQKYFIRLGRAEPSPFLPEGLGAHSFGIGSVRLRNVVAETGGTVLEGTLIAEDYLILDPHDLLWFKLPLSDERLEFYAHVHTAEAVGPKEARFRTVATRLPKSVVAALSQTASFAKAPYEIWPLLSSPCDLHSLGIIGIRVLLANSKSNLPAVVDDMLGLARRLGKDPASESDLLAMLDSLLEQEPKLKDLVSPGFLIETDSPGIEAWNQIHKDVWLAAVALLLRLFPGAGSHSYCKSFGDVSPLALETVFDRPIQELEALILRLRSFLLPSPYANQEIADILRELMTTC